VNPIHAIDWIAMETLRQWRKLDDSVRAVKVEHCGVSSSVRFPSDFQGCEHTPFTAEQVEELLTTIVKDERLARVLIQAWLSHVPQALADDAFRVASFGTEGA
jgi:hypothetical protein